jgi:hypothetical protein
VWAGYRCEKRPGICSKLERSMGATATEMCRDLHRVLDELLDVDPHGLDAAELHAVVVETHRVAARLAAARARHTAVWDTRGVWGSNGTRTAALRLGNECRLSPESAAVEMRRARKLREMPHTFDALARGEISVDHVDLLGRANYGPRAGFFPESEKLLVDSCASMRYRHAERVVAYWRQHADAEGADTEAEALVERRNLSAARTFDGSVYVRGLLDPLGGTVVLDELTRLERQLYEAEKASGEITRNPAQRRADALVEMATRSASTPPGARRPRPLYTILVGFETFAGRICQRRRDSRRPRPTRRRAVRGRHRTSRVRPRRAHHRCVQPPPLHRRPAPLDPSARPPLPAPLRLRRALIGMRRRPHHPPQPTRRHQLRQRPPGLPHPQPPPRQT